MPVGKRNSKAFHVASSSAGGLGSLHQVLVTAGQEDDEGAASGSDPGKEPVGRLSEEEGGGRNSEGEEDSITEGAPPQPAAGFLEQAGPGRYVVKGTSTRRELEQFCRCLGHQFAFDPKFAFDPHGASPRDPERKRRAEAGL